MTSMGSWTNKDKLVTLEQLGRIQDENSPNELNGGKPFSEGYGKMHKKRKESLVYAKLEDFGRALFESQVVVVVAATGTGKTLQLPQYCLHQLGALGVKKRIDVVQPSKIATYACWDRLRIELDSNDSVGYLYGDTRNIPQKEDDARIVVMTDEIYANILAETSEIPVPDSAIIMIDEIHLVSLDVEFLLMAMPKVLERRPDLRLVLASATCDAERLLGHFSEFSPIKVQIDGSAHHVQHVYLHPEDRSFRYNLMILDRLRIFLLDPLSEGDCLVFVPNVAEIDYISGMCSRILIQEHGAGFKNVEFLALSKDKPLDEYTIVSTTRPAEDGSAINKRKVIFATSVAASSITLPDIRLVIISGKNEISHYDATTDATDDITVPCSKDEITQMCGRAGRIQPGLVEHCYYEEDFKRLHQRPPLPSFHSDLTPVLMKRLVFGDRKSLKWFNPPFSEQVETSFRRMIEAGIIPRSDNPALTEKGLLSFKLGLSPEMTTMFEYAAPVRGAAPTYACDLLLLIAISVEGSFVAFMPPDDKYIFRRIRAGLVEGTSDHLSLIMIWIAWRREYRVSRDMDLCEEYGLDRSVCVEIDGALVKLISQYEDIYHIRLTHTDEPSISLAELNKCLLDCLPLHLAVIPNWTPEYNEPVAEWGVIRVCADGLLYRNLLVEPISFSAAVHPMHVVFSSLRGVRRSASEKDLYMQVVTAIPPEVAISWGAEHGKSVWINEEPR